MEGYSKTGIESSELHKKIIFSVALRPTEHGIQYLKTRSLAKLVSHADSPVDGTYSQFISEENDTVTTMPTRAARKSWKAQLWE